jgi:soluble lytic murein transglycosylase
MSGRGIAWLAAIAGLVLFAKAGAAEQIYRYVDERGVVHLTNVPTDDRYRKFVIGRGSGGSGKGILILMRRERSATHIPGRAHASVYVPVRVGRGGRSSTAYDPLIARAATRHGLPAALVKAVVKAESNFEVAAVSNKGAQGLMQLMPGTADDMGVGDPFRAEDNVYGGTRYLRAMYDRFGDWERAIAAYNAGPGAVEKHGGIPPYAETQQYVERVLHYYRRYDGDFSRASH